MWGSRSGSAGSLLVACWVNRMPVDSSADIPFASTSFEGKIASPRTRRRPKAYERAGKRAFDLILVLLMLPLALPVMGLIALLIAASGQMPFYRHRRVGQNGAPFDCLKFQTMVGDAEARLQTLLAADAEAAQQWDRNQKLTDDPRITRLGRLLRISSLDELPQLFNVLRGEMSLVGPRPVTSDELARYNAAADVILRLRPGITGIWQVECRGRTSGYEDRVLFDLVYYDGVSLATDLRLLWRTVGAVLGRTGQ